MENILLDFAGDMFLGKELVTFSNGLNSNTYLADIQTRFVSYLESRLLVTSLINKLGGDVANINWYFPVNYILYLNNVENQNFIGSLKKRKEMCQSQGLTNVLRISILATEEAGIYIGTDEQDVDTAVEIANCLQVLADRGIEIPKVRVVIPCNSSSKYIERHLYREQQILRSEQYKVFNVVFACQDNSDFLDGLSTGQDAIVAFISTVFDKLTERKIENDSTGG